jgi:hypothetical protein
MNIWERWFRRQTILFLHIPKCAGTTLTEEIIKKNYSPRELLIFYERGTEALIECLQAMSRRKQKKIRCIAGHFAFGIHRYLTARPAVYITLLRDPIERVVSHYYHTLRHQEHYLHQQVTEKNYSLKEYVRRGLSKELNNGQTRILAGIGWGVEYGRCTRAMLEQAKENIEKHFAAVGISERFDVFLQHLAESFNWKIPVYEKRNMGAGRMDKGEVDHETLEVIKEYNQLDIELYNEFWQDKDILKNLSKIE